VLIFYIFRYEKVSSFGSSGELEELISITRSGEGFQYKADDEYSVVPYVSVYAAYLVGIPLATLAFFLILAQLDARGALDGLTITILGNQDPISSEGVKLFSCIPAFLFGFITICLIRPRIALQNALKKRVDSIAYNANKEMTLLDELLSLGASMKAMGNDFHINYLVDFKTEMVAFVGTHAKEILSSSSEFHNLIEEKLQSAQEEHAKLSKARDLYTSVKQYYEKIGYKVNRTRSENMIYELGTYAVGLESDNLKSYIMQKQWDDFYTVMEMMKKNLEELNDIASNHQEDTFYEYEEEQVGFKTPTELDKEQEAYETLGLLPTATNELIKQVRDRLVYSWHPDGNPGIDEERLKKVNSAYDFLKEKRNIK